MRFCCAGRVLPFAECCLRAKRQQRRGGSVGELPPTGAIVRREVETTPHRRCLSLTPRSYNPHSLLSLLLSLSSPPSSNPLYPLTLRAGATVISHYLTIKSQELIKRRRQRHAEHFGPLSPGPVISKAACDPLRAFQVCETQLPTAGKSLLPAVIKTDNLRGERKGEARGREAWAEERKESERKKWSGAFRRLELKQRGFH